MQIKILQRGFNFSQDGPGNRLVYHLQGCSMHCPWCSNPESIPVNGCMIATDPKADALCPKGAVQNGRPDNEICKSCDKDCLKAKSPCLRRSYTEQSVEELVREAEKSAMMFFGDGGVTFTGGEATVQFDALCEALTTLKAKGIHTAIETNGSHKKLPELFPVIDYLIMDLKHWNNETHKKTIGLSNETTIDNIRKAASLREQLLVRIPLVGGFNSSTQDAERFSEILSCLKAGQAVEVLRYHEYGKDKWTQCGMDYVMEDAFVSDDVYRDFCKVLQDKGLTLIRT